MSLNDSPPPIPPTPSGYIDFEYFWYVINGLKKGLSGVQSVTGLDTDNTDPLNPIVKIAIGSGLSGLGTQASPLVATGGGGGVVYPANLVPYGDGVTPGGKTDPVNDIFIYPLGSSGAKFTESGIVIDYVFSSGLPTIYLGDLVNQNFIEFATDQLSFNTFNGSSIPLMINGADGYTNISLTDDNLVGVWLYSTLGGGIEFRGTEIGLVRDGVSSITYVGNVSTLDLIAILDGSAFIIQLSGSTYISAYVGGDTSINADANIILGAATAVNIPLFAGLETGVMYYDNTGNLTKLLTYDVQLSQSGTSAPTVTNVNQNTLGNLVWSYVSTGQYIGTLAGAFPDYSKVKFIMGNSGTDIVFYCIVPIDSNSFYLNVLSSLLFSSDGLLSNTNIQIIIYP